MPVLKIKKNGCWVEVWGSTSSGSCAKTQSSVTLLANEWTGTTSPYLQVVNIDKVTPSSQVDFQLTPKQFEELSNARISFMAINDNGVVTVNATGNKPTSDYTIDISITNVDTQ